VVSANLYKELLNWKLAAADHVIKSSLVHVALAYAGSEKGPTTSGLMYMQSFLCISVRGCF
jgi:hypothetical protein